MTFRASVERYLGAVAQQYHRGDAREESYYDVLKQLWEELGSQLSSAHATLTVLPRQTEAGNPDMRVWSGQQHVTGYIEAKEPGVTNLDHVEVSEQLKRYRAAFPNVILTNFLEFRLYRFGQPMGQPVTIGSLQALQAGMKVPLQHEDQFRELVERFFDFQLPRAYTAQTLAVALADRTRFLQRQVLDQLVKDEQQNSSSDLVSLMREFKQVLMSDLTSDTFVDLYAQTITYGLFAARMRVTGPFTRETALNGIPATIGILHKLFKYISIGDTPERLRVIIDDIADVLAVADTDMVFKGYDKNGRDPVADFYETFLGEYDPAKKKQHGVYYTPQPVVSYIVRSVDQILRDSFGKPDGLADPSVTVLDPAAGTMTFPATAVRLAAETYKAKYGDGSLDSWIKGHVLRDFYAFELMMAPYAIGHLRMGTLLTELGYTMSPDDRFKLYLTNTLDISTAEQNPIPGLSPLADESHMADAVKTTQPVLVIMGNPPYSVSSSNKSAFIERIMQTYKEDVKGERNIQPLSDDYIKFFRFAQWKIDQAGSGVAGFVTNRSYLSGIIHRGMRHKLLDSFDCIYVLDLHGDSRGSARHNVEHPVDENVFDIQQGVAIAILVKSPPSLAPSEHLVAYADLRGTREQKYEYLSSNSVSSGTCWLRTKPIAPAYSLTGQAGDGTDPYWTWRPLDDIFMESTNGVKSHRDALVLGFEREPLDAMVRRMTDSKEDSSDLRAAYGIKDTATWHLDAARVALSRDIRLRTGVQRILYRPFDERWIADYDALVERPRRAIMQQMSKPNVGLVVVRRGLGDMDYSWVLAVNTSISHGVFFIGNEGNEYLFPLYHYDFGSYSDLDASNAGNEPHPARTVNMWPDLLRLSANGLGLRLLPDGHGGLADGSMGPEDLFAYIYAVLYSPLYRERYAEFLKTDYPRIPFTKDRDTFFKLADLGQQLIDLHLMRCPDLDNSISRFCGKGDSAVTKVEYDAGLGRVSINPTQYFDGITPGLWTYQIGGYQVLAKWLKDRKGRFLTSADTQHYSRIVTALSKTMSLQLQMDEHMSGLFV